MSGAPIENERGFIALARGVFDHPVVGAQKPFDRLNAWSWMIFEAAWKARRYDAGGVTVMLQRGQLAHSIRFLADAWGWHRAKVERFLTRLKTETMIETSSETGITIISICNYETYQNLKSRTETPYETANETPARQQRDRKEPSNNKKEDIALQTSAGTPSEVPWSFETWYSLYIRKKSRKDAERAFLKLQRSGEISFELLLERTRAHAATWAARPKADLQFCEYPASWLNGGSYLDEPDAAQTSGPAIPSRDPASFTDEEWKKRLAMRERGEAWPATQWGPAPGTPGCLVPARLLMQPVTATLNLESKA